MSRFNSGWVKLHRSVFESDIAQNMYLFCIFNWLILRANYAPGKAVFCGRQIEMRPGMLITSIKEIADHWQISRSTVHKWLGYLVSSERIANEVRTHGCLITILNYDLYQSTDIDARTDREHLANVSRTPAEREVALNKEVKKERKEYTPQFEAFWNEYPRKTEKTVAALTFAKLTPTEQEQVVLAAKNYAADCKKEKREKNFIKHPSSFLGKDRWVEWAAQQPTKDPVKFENFDKISAGGAA